MQRLREKLEPIIDDHGHAGANGANRKPTNTRTIDDILQALATEVRAIVPEKAPESIIDIEGGDGNRDDCVEYGEDRGWNKAIDTMISNAKERGLL